MEVGALSSDLAAASFSFFLSLVELRPQVTNCKQHYWSSLYLWFSWLKSICAGCQNYDLMRRIASVVGNQGKKQTLQKFFPTLPTSDLHSNSLICDTQLSAFRSISKSNFRTTLGQQSSPALNSRPVHSHVGSQIQTFSFASTASGSSELKEKIMVVPLPKLSPHMSNGKISKWLKQPGDEIAMYDVIFEVDTENLSEDAYKVGDFAGTVTMLVEVSLLLRLNTTHQSEWHSTLWPNRIVSWLYRWLYV